MPLILLTKPEEEPLSLADAKAYLRVDNDAEDALIGSLIVAARRHLEDATGKRFVRQLWRLSLDAWPVAGVVSLPLAPVLGIAAARLREVDGTEVPLDITSWSVDGANRLHTDTHVAVRRPFAGIEIDVEAGFGDAGDVPQDVVQAIRLLVAHLFEHRSGADHARNGLPLAAAALIATERRVRLA
jgi:uncharacterized phiE125 gp8 family phage protein